MKTSSSNKNLFFIIVCFSLIFFCANVIHADQWCKDYPGVCQPQCVSWARSHSDIKICGNANQWPGRAKQYGYKVTDKPKKGMAMVIDLSKYGHVMAITDSEKKKNNEYSLRIAHSNFDNKCSKESNIKATYYKKSKKIKFRSGELDGKTYKVIAIIKE